MIPPEFRKTVIISLLGHATAFGIFSFSFGVKLPVADYGAISSWAGVLKNYELTPGLKQFAPKPNLPLIKPAPVLPNRKENEDYPPAFPDFLKPHAFALPQYEKQIFSAPTAYVSLPKRNKESVVMFYPELPYHFNLYFKDRQVAHVELQYHLSGAGENSTILVKRKISSGNLETDLLCMRYITHYLSIQHDTFFTRDWQTVKIELEQKK